MPTVEVMTVKPAEVRRNDLIDDVLPSTLIVNGKRVANGGHTVTATRPRDKTYEFETTGGALRVYRNAEVTVRRQVPTAEEILERDTGHLNEAFGEAAQSSVEAVQAAVAKLGEASAYQLSLQWQYVGSYLDAVAERDIYSAIFQVMKAGENGHPLAEAILIVAADIRERLLNGYDLSTSTNDVSNAARLASMRTQTAFLRSYLVHLAERVHPEEVKES